MSQNRVERLLADLSPGSRAETAAIVADEFASGVLTDAERRIALDILAVLAQDVAIQVREALAEHVRSCPFLPREIALSLAHDVDSVAVPVIRMTSVLTEADLLAIVRRGSTAKQIAVAGRDRVSEAVSDALLATNKRRVVGAVIENDGAAPSERALLAALTRFETDGRVQAQMAMRASLPPPVAERLLRVAADEIGAQVMMRHALPRGLFEEMLMHGRDKALSRRIAEFSDDEAARFAVTLHDRRMLPPMLLLRCLCEGRVAFVEAALASLAGVPVGHAQTLVWDRGPLGLEALYRRARLPEALLGAFRAALAVRRRTRAGERGLTEEEAIAEIVDRLGEHYPALAGDDLEAVLGELWRVAAGPAAAIA